MKIMVYDNTYYPDKIYYKLREKKKDYQIKNKKKFSKKE
jgi:hypothetical protein